MSQRCVDNLEWIMQEGFEVELDFDNGVYECIVYMGFDVVTHKNKQLYIAINTVVNRIRKERRLNGN